MSKLLKLSIMAGCLAALSVGQALAQEAAPAANRLDPNAMPPPYDCTLAEAVLCKAGATCTPTKTLGDLPLPARVLVHFEEQVIATTAADGLPHISKISDLSRSGDIIVAQGVDGGTGWQLHVTANDDEATFVAASDDFVISAFGTCKPAQ